MVTLTNQELHDATVLAYSFISTQNEIHIPVPGRVHPDKLDPYYTYPTRTERVEYILTFRRVGGINWELITPYMLTSG